MFAREEKDSRAGFAVSWAPTNLGANIMTVPSSLAAGEQVLLADPAFSWEAAATDTSPPRVVLTASMHVGADPSTSPSQGRSVATLAIQMDGQIALQLYGKLYALVRSQGWLPEE